MRWRSASLWGPALSILLLVGVLCVLHKELAHVSYTELIAACHGIPGTGIAAAIALTLLNYLVLSGYEVLACRYVGRPQPFRRILLSSFVGNAFANSLGFSFLSGASVKFRLYSAWGLDSADIARVVAFTSSSIWLGLFALGGPALLVDATALTLPLGIVLAAAPWAYVLLACVWREPVHLFGFRLSSPGPGLAMRQLLFSILDWVLAASVLYVLLPEPGPATVFLTRFFLAQLTGVVSQVPGGLGIFESTFLVLSPGRSDNEQLFAALLVFRSIYYLGPVLLASLLMAGREVMLSRSLVGMLVQASLRWISALTPRILAACTFLTGTVLLVSGATPSVPNRLEWLDALIPLPVVETSHFLASVTGMSLLFLARGIQRRLDIAYHLTLGLLVLGIVTSLLKGLDFEEALILVGILLAFIPSKSWFSRRSSLSSSLLSSGWVASVLAVVIATIWIVLFAFKHVEYSHDLWWTFALDAEASRALRAEVGAAMTGLVLGWWWLFRPKPYRQVGSQTELPDKLRNCVRRSPETRSNLALLGDKEFVFSESGQGFVMFGVSGKTWVSMGDPVGPESELSELAWIFREACDAHGGRPVFYEVSKEHLHVYLELGLSVLKLGEEAIVDLPSFSLDGAARKNFRNIRNTLEKQGCSMEIVPPEAFPSILPELRIISQEWLGHKNTREKRFSLGRFDERYLANFPTAIVRQGGRTLAFANVWESANWHELSIDLMRTRQDAPAGIMDYLICMLMLWGREQGYARFNLGMAPLSGLARHTLGPSWNKLGNFLYAHAEGYYNFKGLRKYKEKFNPRWEPRFLASPGGFALPAILADIAALISGGFKGVIRK